MCQAVSILVLSASLGGFCEPSQTKARKEIEARWWFNNPVYRLHDDLRVILFFFKCDQKETAEWTKRLDRIARRPDFVVIGLTSDGRKEAERFVARRRVRFTVGAGSRSAEEFGIRRLPAVRVLDAQDHRRIETVKSLESLDTALASWKGKATRDQIEARWWFNNPPYRLHDQRRVILFFFGCKDKVSAEWTRRLNRIARRPDVIVIGLTSDGREKAERFIARTNPRFTIGSRSRGAKELGIRRLPALRVVDPENRRRIEPVDSVKSVRQMLPSWKEPLDRLTDEESFRQYIASDADGGSRRAAIKKLLATLRPDGREAFVAFAEARLPLEHDPFVRGNLRYYRDIARGIPRNDRERSPSTQYGIEFRDNPHDPAWAEVHAFQKQLDDAPQRLLEEYHIHGTDGPNDVLIRRMIVDTLEIKGSQAKPSDPYRAEARAVLMEIIPFETDHSIRLFGTIGLITICQIGDSEVIDLLESLALSEPNDFTVRPMMEYAAYRLRTGIVEARLFEPLP